LAGGTGKKGRKFRRGLGIFKRNQHKRTGVLNRHQGKKKRGGEVGLSA